MENKNVQFFLGNSKEDFCSMSGGDRRPTRSTGMFGSIRNIGTHLYRAYAAYPRGFYAGGGTVAAVYGGSRLKRMYDAVPSMESASRSRSSGIGYARSAGETKFFDTDISYTSSDIPVTGSCLPSLNLVTVGTASNERIGRSFRIVGLSIRGRMWLNNTGTLSSDMIRVIVYLDRQCNGTSATPAQILSTLDINAHNKLENSLRFKTLCTFTVSMNPEAGFGGNVARISRPFKRTVRLNIPIEMDTGATVGDIKSNNIGLLVISANALCKMTAASRIRFKDS